MNRLQLAMMDFNFDIRYKKGSEMPADFLSRNFMEIGAISSLNINWTHAQEKGNLSKLIKENLEKKWVNKFPMPEWYKKDKFIANMALLSGSRRMINCCYMFHLNFCSNSCLKCMGIWVQQSAKMQGMSSGMLFLAQQG
jgi:hypothetical protein